MIKLSTLDKTSHVTSNIQSELSKICLTFANRKLQSISGFIINSRFRVWILHHYSGQRKCKYLRCKFLTRKNIWNSCEGRVSKINYKWNKQLQVKQTNYKEANKLQGSKQITRKQTNYKLNKQITRKQTNQKWHKQITVKRSNYVCNKQSKLLPY